MFPMEFDCKLLSSLPLPAEQGIQRVKEVLKALMMQKIVPYFRNRRGTDLMQLARIKQNISIHRLEDDKSQNRIVCLTVRTQQGWSIQIHERVFDLMAFVTPLKRELSLGSGNVEEKKMLAFAELLLRHEAEHMLYPGLREQEVIRSDVDFAMSWLEKDPTSYQMLREMLSDEMNGISGEHYLKLLDLAKEGRPYEYVINSILNDYVMALADLPGALLEQIFLNFDSGIKPRILGECYRRSRSTAYSLVKRSFSFQKILRLFAVQIKRDQQEAIEVFNAFKDRWGLAVLFHELDLPEPSIEENNPEELFELFKLSLKDFTDECARPSPPLAGNLASKATAQSPKPAPSPPVPPKSLKERIEDARNDPYFPEPVMELIDKNKANAAGQSGAKYSELIETLLAIPWGRIRRIWVSPADFEEGLSRTHYGLEKPKEVVSDIFSNLIWRYQHFREEDRRSWRRTGSALLFVGPPGVGKTSLAISIARSLGIPFHKLSLAGMRDEADIRGYGFTYEGSKPGPIVQGLIKMGAMNGMFIMDEADKTESVALSTLLEILDPEQNHMFHDKYTQSTVDIDLSNCHFVLTANTLETVPPAVIDRCEVIHLDRYSIEEKIAIARQYLIRNVRERHLIGESDIAFEADEENDLLRYIIRNYTAEAGVRDLERAIRTLFLRVQRKEILTGGKTSVVITREKIKEYLEEPGRNRLINDDDRVGEMMGLGVNMEMGIGSLIPIQVTPLAGRSEAGGDWRGYTSIVHATGNLERIMDESRKVAATAISHCAEKLGVGSGKLDEPIHLHFMGGSTKKDGPSAGGAIALALASLFLNRKIRRDVCMTGEIDTQGRVTGIGGLNVKLETAYMAGAKTMVIPTENLRGMGGIERLPDALKEELQILTYDEWKAGRQLFDYNRQMLQVVAVDHIIQAADIAFIDEKELNGIEELFIGHANHVFEENARGRDPSLRTLRIVVGKLEQLLDSGPFDSWTSDSDLLTILPVRSEGRGMSRERLYELGENIEVRDFDPRMEKLSEVIRKIWSSLDVPADSRLGISVVAPHDLLRRDGIRVEDFPADRSFEGLRLFAQSCTVENVEIETCQSMLHNVYRHLTGLRSSLLAECPFIVEKDGTYMVTFSSIPEKYRLDTQRAEELLNRFLGRWLSVIDSSGGQEKDRMPRAQFNPSAVELSAISRKKDSDMLPKERN